MNSDDLFDPIGSYNPTSFSNLTSQLPEVNLANYLATFSPRAFPSRVIVTYPPYVSSLSTILEKASKETVEAYLIARVALQLAPLLGPGTEAWKTVRELKEILGGMKRGVLPDRAEYCAKQVSDTMVSQEDVTRRLLMILFRGMQPVGSSLRSHLEGNRSRSLES